MRRLAGLEKRVMNGVKRRVLMMCYFFPPIHSVGANRSVSFATNLKEFGWTPVVLTVKRSRIPWEPTGAFIPAGIEVVRSVELNLHGVVAFADAALYRVLRLFGCRTAPSYTRRALCIPDPQIAWLCVPAAVRLARAADCVYVSCSPFSAAILGAFVAKLCRKPLILDFRDPWMGSGLEHRLEKWVLRHADALILNTPQSQSAYARRFPELASRMVCIPNGYDVIAEPRPVGARSDMFTVMHVGEFYGTRRPDTLLEAMAELNLSDMEFVQVGPGCPALERYASRLRIRHIDLVPRERALELMQTASLLYLKMHEETDYSTLAVPAKAYEYLATGVPILAELRPGDATDLVKEYGTTPEIVTPGSKAELAAALRRAYSRRHGPIGIVDSRFVQRFNRKYLTRQLAFVLEQVVDGEVCGHPSGRDSASRKDHAD